MNVNDLQDDYDDYDDYGGNETTLPASLSGYAQQPPPESYTQAYSPPMQASTSALPQSYSPPAGGSSYGGGGLGNMSSIGSSLPSTSPPGQPSKYGGGDKCPRCGKTVYFAEAKEGPNNIKYHKTCFKCMICSKLLDSTFSERQGDVFCKMCYGKEFGPKGFGFGASVQSSPDPTPSPESRKAVTPGPPAQKTWNAAGSGGSGAYAPVSPNRSAPSATGGSGTTAQAPRFGGGDKCGRCQKTVYFAEAREGPNNIKYHKPCFSCLLCNKILDSHFAERKGDLYCKPCYAQEFGPKGFGFAGGQA